MAVRIALVIACDGLKCGACEFYYRAAGRLPVCKLFREELKPQARCRTCLTAGRIAANAATEERWVEASNV